MLPPFGSCSEGAEPILEPHRYDGRDAEQMWSFPAALMFSLSIITMIGYGNLVPRTGWGRFATVVYAVFGIPLYVLYFLNIGEILAGAFKFIYTYIYGCTRRTQGPPRRVIVPSTACLWVITAYVITGAIMFTKWEQWSFLDSTYFCVTSLCKLGLGDFVPGTASSDGETKLVINFVYILVGLGIVAMCFNLMREQIRVKVEEFTEDFRQCLEDTRVRLIDWMGPPHRLLVKGYSERSNEILYCPPLDKTPNRRLVAYFGGDIQDYAEEMGTHRDHKNYTDWSLESTAFIFNSAFRDADILVIRPKRIEYKTFSCFENFVQCGETGVPKHSPDYHAVEHFTGLLDSFCLETRQDNDHHLILVGFSKGCVVLNQFLHEFPTKSNGFVGRITDMYWLDGGHSGGKNTWVVSKDLLGHLAKLGIRVHVHVSPYQVNDERRPWIRQEERLFYSILKQLKVPIERRLHSPDAVPSIDLHFRILKEFHLDIK